MQKVTSLIDVNAPCEEVFNTVVNIERRMQLSPLWGISQLQEIAPNYPEPGSSYRVRVLTDVPFGLANGTLNATQSALSGLFQVISLKWKLADSSHLNQPELTPFDHAISAQVQIPELNRPVAQEYFISEHQPPHKFSYYLDTDRKTIITWKFQEIPFGTRIHYEEVFSDENAVSEDFIPTVYRVIREWLTNIKRYCELRGDRGRVFIKWFLDRFYIKLRPDQRRFVLLILVMQAIGLATFMIAVIGWGVASLFF